MYDMFTVCSIFFTYLKKLSWELRMGELELLEKYVRGGWYGSPGVVQAFCDGTLEIKPVPLL